MTRYILQKLLKQSFQRYGRFVARHPIWFLVFPVILTAILATGLVRARTLRDIENLTVPFNSRSIRDRNLIEKLFPMNLTTDFDITRITRLGYYASIIVLAKDGGSVLRREIFRDIVAIDRLVKNVTVKRSNVTWDYSQLCCRKGDQCADTNVALKLEDKLIDFNKGAFKFRHPFDLDPLTYKLELYGMNLGGITKDLNGYVEEAKAFRLMYYLNREPESILWQEAFEETMQGVEFPTVSTSYITASTASNELQSITDKLFPLGSIAFAMILLFSVISLITTSKPYLGLAAGMSVSLAIVSAFGCVMYCGVEYIDVNVALIFIMLGMGLDDSFILLSSWRKTDPAQDFVRRMENTYENAAVSVTITSLTDLLSFLLCIFNPFPCIRIFSIYACASIIFTYVYQITIFGACLALSGSQEEKTTPCRLTMCQMKSLTAEEDKENKAPRKYSDSREIVNLFFRDKLGQLHSKKLAQCFALALSSGLVAVGIYGITYLEEGLEPKDLFSHNTKSFLYTERYYKYYTDYAHRIHIVINQPLNYANVSVQSQIEETIGGFEEKAFVCKSWCTDSWLKFYLNFSTTGVSRFSLRGYDLSQEQDFIDGLRNVFLRFPQTKMMNQDIVYNGNYTKIEAARFFVNTLDVSNRATEKEMLQTVWDVTDHSSIPITTFALWFPLYEQLLYIRPLTTQALAITASLIFVVFVLFVPDFLIATCISITTLLIQVEVIGFMSLWGVKLDIVTLLLLVMCIGFSLNYPAHVCFAFATSGRREASESVKHAMYAVGLPIVQGAITTLLGVTVLGFQDKYFMVLFFKVIYLVVLLVALYSLFILPSVLVLTSELFFGKTPHGSLHIPVRHKASTTTLSAV